MARQLAIGQKYKQPVLRAEWMKTNKDRGFDVLISQNIGKPIARYFSVCSSAPVTGWKEAVDNGCCGAHVRARGPNRDELEIISIDLNHTCASRQENGQQVQQNGRKRNYNTKDIMTVSDVLTSYEPTRTKEGNAKQFASITKSATGFEMKKGQASAAVRTKSHDTIEAQIGQYLLIPSAFKAYMESDPDGTFILEDRVCRWNRDKRQFYRAYCSLSIAKKFWKHGLIKMFVCDGTFTKLRSFQHILLICVTFDGNNQVIILAFATVEIENSENWVFFKENLEKDFPGCEVWMSDADKGIESNAFTLSMSQDGEEAFEKSRCARHLSNNCHENASGKMNEEDKLTILKLAKSRTKEVYEKRLQAIRECKEEWADHLDSRKEEFVTYTFLEKGISRYGKVTSDAVENTNSALMAERSLPIMHMIESIIKYQKEKYASRKEQAATWIAEGKTMTRCAEEQDAMIGDTASRRTVETIQSNHPIYKANVSVGTDSGWTQQFVEVEVNVEEGASDCPCKNYDETGANCCHVKALLLQLGQLGVGEKWYHPRFHTKTYSDSHSADVPSMSLAGKLDADADFLPPEYKKPAGRPRKKRRSRACLRKTGATRTCHACGKPAHFSTSCTDPSTEYRVNHHLGKALQYCKRIGATDVEEH